MSLLTMIARAAVDTAAVSFAIAVAGNLLLGFPLSTGFLALAWAGGAAVAVASSRSKDASLVEASHEGRSRSKR